MEGLLVGAATGALKPVLEKLAALMGDEYKRFKGVRREVQSLTDELSAMHTFLLKMSEEENPDVQDKAWLKEVRELSYDMEDCLDEFMLRVDDKSDCSDGIIDKFKNFLTKIKTRRRVAKAIEDLKVQVKDIRDRNNRYRSNETVINTSNAAVDHRALAIFEDASKLIGIDGPKDELVNLLAREDIYSSGPWEVPKVVAIVGSGGMGKTTLANQVYVELRNQFVFSCSAFVSVSRNPDMMKILRIILSDVSDKPYADTEAGSIQQLIGKITDFLNKKRYLIVVDDIWNIETWDILKYALFQTKFKGIIITTTRIHDVAKACCSSYGALVYKMRPLTLVDSKTLFLKRIFGSKERCPTDLMAIANKILEKCGGLPLAIISLSSLLANKPWTVDQWDYVEKSMGRALGNNPDFQSMMRILSVSYFDLPHHLKTCVLYLSIFPEDAILDKKRLVRRWIAEGFIQKEQGYTMYELGEMCFNELINRSLIQARGINMYGDVTACQVHDTILDFISLKSEEENFATVFCDSYQMLGPHTKVRRLSLHASSKEKVSMLTELNISHVRSLTVFKYSVFKMMLVSLSDFNFLRVLDLQGCRQVEGQDLLYIGNLFQLKYLNLCDTGVCELPEQIRKLQYLNTLNVRKSKVRELPATVLDLRRLVHLVYDTGVKLPAGIGGMIALEELEGIDVFNQPIDFPHELGQLNYLRRLSFVLRSLDSSDISTRESHFKEYMDNIVSSLCKLVHLRSLCFYIHGKFAEKFSMDWRCFISKVRQLVGTLNNLQFLTIYVNTVEMEDILALGNLKALTFLRLVAHECFQGKRVTIRGSDGFRCLKCFDFVCAVPVIFEAGAMPKLEKLTLMYSSIKTALLGSTGDFPFGIQHLFSLDSVFCVLHLRRAAVMGWFDKKKARMAHLSCELAVATLVTVATVLNQVLDAEGAIKRAVHAHPMSPKLKLRQTNFWKILELESFSSSHHKNVYMSVFDEIEQRLIQLKMQVEYRKRNCPSLMGCGNCKCRGFTDIWRIRRASQTSSTTTQKRSP